MTDKKLNFIQMVKETRILVPKRVKVIVEMKLPITSTDRDVS
jgi:hypothetical protein